jgi:hypothetical protein
MRVLIVSVAAFVALIGASAAIWAAPPVSKNFNTHLSGGEEVPPRDTMAQGQANFKVSNDATSIGFKLIVSNIENVVAAHIHCGAAGVNGPVGVTLFSGGIPGAGGSHGILAQGEITAPDAGNGCGWVTIRDVIDAMLSGDAYVNVHTNDGLEPPNSGPGDFPGGEIRGQIRENGSS